MSPLQGPTSYHVFLHDESNVGGQQIVARIETDNASLVLSDSRAKRTGSIEPYLVPGRTGRWRVDNWAARGKIAQGRTLPGGAGIE
jgi:hypothetical protein